MNHSESESGTYRAGVARKVVDLLQLGKDEDGLSLRLEPLSESGEAEDRRLQCTLETARDEQVRGGLDGVLGRFVQSGRLLAAARGEWCVADCGRSSVRSLRDS